MKVLVTGFQPFGKETMNPSFEAVRLLPDEINGAQIVKAEIPVVFRKGGNEVQKLVRQENPDIVLLVGQAGGRSSMNVERVAINCEDCPSGFPDNEGNCPQGGQGRDRRHCVDYQVYRQEPVHVQHSAGYGGEGRPLVSDDGGQLLQ